MSHSVKPTEDSQEQEEPKSLEDKIQQAIKDLSSELQDNMRIKQACERTIKERDVRISQITGAIHELQKLLSEEKED